MIHEEGHLGGFVIGGDPDTYFPSVWFLLWEHLQPESFLDIGCGESPAMDEFYELGVDIVMGIDGVSIDNAFVEQHDFTTGPVAGLQDFDLIWCCEFVEHIEERFLPNVLEAFSHGKVLAMTHAVPGQRGYHHVNCRDDAYWVNQLGSIGFLLNRDLTDRCRNAAMIDCGDNNYFTRSGLVFDRSWATEMMAA